MYFVRLSRMKISAPPYRISPKARRKIQNRLRKQIVSMQKLLWAGPLSREFQKEDYN